MNHTFLSALREGDQCVLRSIDIHGGQRRRMMDLGMLQGTRVTVAYIAPAGSPMALWVKGTLLALRTEDCGKILVETSD